MKIQKKLISNGKLYSQPSYNAVLSEQRLNNAELKFRQRSYNAILSERNTLRTQFPYNAVSTQRGAKITTALL